MMGAFCFVLFWVFFGELVLFPHVLVVYWALSLSWFTMPLLCSREFPISSRWDLNDGSHPVPLFFSLLVLWVSFFLSLCSLSPLFLPPPPLLPLPRPQVLTPQIRR